ncbi:bifunctional riboflavin kinase/FAD synthetase [Chitinilyticum piscinae]|uniref:Riboflavin biosynthesis protein n=1 Tax=Chitinilyticum piscinae TaxID=2866724 RepID=A0A8J7K1M9_9NEIS|nr:bifunctional riboflavin kinase/FAD synthetase [Chitinilyticum piscinae]MBE9609446.1 bifunctional riboflavin kinase/FAD synthetase [Chitinilyticum piscinae]
MRVVRGAASAHLPPCVLAIGNFDGLHLGHQALLRRLRADAETAGLACAVLTFEPHPRELFTPDAAPARLTSLREKIELLAASGVDYLIVQRFDRRFAAIEAESFRDDMVVRELNARQILIGDDFRFGRQRRGDVALLAAHPALQVSALSEIQHQDERISSTAVRAALANGEMEHAAALLGRAYSISGRVVGGDRIGRQLGFPTANIQLKHNRPPLLGIFVVEVHGLGGVRQAVASLGFRPTIRGGDLKPKLEVHLFDFDADIYRRHLRVDFLHKLRDEEKYPDLESLTAQIARDCAAARQWFAINRPL